MFIEESCSVIIVVFLSMQVRLYFDRNWISYDGFWVDIYFFEFLTASYYIMHLINNIIVKLTVRISMEAEHFTNQNPQLKTKAQQKQKQAIRNFKSLNRKSMYSPNNFTPIYIANVNPGITKNQQNIHNVNISNNINNNNINNNNISYTTHNLQSKSSNQNNGNKSIGYNPNNPNKQNIKDNINKNSGEQSNRSYRKLNNYIVSEQPQSQTLHTQEQLKSKIQNNSGENNVQVSGYHILHGKISSGFRNRSTSKNNKIKDKDKEKDKEENVEIIEDCKQPKNRKTKGDLQNSPVGFGEFKDTNNSRNNKIINSNSKVQGDPINAQISSRVQSKSSYLTGSPNISSFKSPLKNQPGITPGHILYETVSKDGQFKITSRNLTVDQLKQAAQLEHFINLKSKKQSMRELQLQSQQINGNNASSHSANKRNVSNTAIQNGGNGGQNLQNLNSPKKYVLDPSKVSTKENGNIRAYAVNSNQGISRKYNQDRVSIILNISKNGIKASFFAIYDGHGGANCCDFLTQNLHQLIFNSKYFPYHPRQAIIEGMKEAETKFIEQVKRKYQQKKQLDRSGSCAIILLMVGDDCYIANLGDSRAVLSTCHGKPMYSLSRDHKPTDSAQQLRILKQGGRIYRTQMTKIKRDNMNENFREQEMKGLKRQQKQNQNQTIIGPLRVFPGKLSVTRTFGDIEAKDPEFGGIRNCISSEPQICKYSLTGKQDFILLGCDGLFEKLDSEQAIEQAWKSIRKHRKNSIHQAVGAAAQSVVKLCMDRKGTDNITAILVSLSSLGLEANLNDYASV